MALDASNRRYWIIEWLSRQGPPEWHGYSEKHNWDGSCAELHWIIQQPECDRATAANIFWLSEPTYYLDGEHDHDPVAQMDLEIVERWSSGFYTTSRFAFGGDYMDEHRPDMMMTIGSGGHEIPASLGEPIEGGEPFPLFHELPVEIDVNWHNATGKEPSRGFLERNGLSWDGSKIVGTAPAFQPARQVVERPGKLTGSQLSQINEALPPSSFYSAASAPGDLSRDEVSARMRRLRERSQEGSDEPEHLRESLLGKLARFWRF
jgi:hypothetical protein